MSGEQLLYKISEIAKRVNLHTFRSYQEPCFFRPDFDFKGQFWEYYGGEIVDRNGITVSNDSICNALGAIAAIQHICGCSTTKMPDSCKKE